MTTPSSLDINAAFHHYVKSMKRALIDMVEPDDSLIMHGIIHGHDKSELVEFDYVALPIKDLAGEGLDKEALDKLYSIMAFFVDNVIGAGNIYLTNRNKKLVIEIAW
jgi:hypothetical protein